MSGTDEASRLTMRLLADGKMRKAPDQGFLKELDLKDDVAAGDRMAARTRVLKQLADFTPRNANERQEASHMAAAVDKELALDMARGYVAGQARQSGNDGLKAAFLVLVNAHDTLKAALAALAGTDRDELIDAGVPVPKLRALLREYYKPSSQTLRDAGLNEGQKVLLGGGSNGSSFNGSDD